MFPIRGQVVRVSPLASGQFALDGGEPEATALTYVIPRSTDCIVGGTAERGNGSLEVDQRVAERILARAKELVPELNGCSVLEHRVGLRPGRPEVRLERGRLTDGRTVVHNYGHG